jgi:hypothetical protein
MSDAFTRPTTLAFGRSGPVVASRSRLVVGWQPLAMSRSCVLTTLLTLAASAYLIFGIFGLTAKQPLLSTLWHVDNIKISHKDPKVVDGVLGLLEMMYGKEAPLTITQGKDHGYLGMRWDYGEDRKVKIHMIDYIQKKMLAEIPDDMNGEAATPAANNIFEVNESADKLDEAFSPQRG